MEHDRFRAGSTFSGNLQHIDFTSRDQVIERMNAKVKSVLVIGAGIAGIQASLDLADSGCRVYLIEQSPAIGGVMPMLDKTFPTNDCSLCILSPKLVECGRHPNIKIFPYSDVIAVRGEPGNFTIMVRRRPRYIDSEKCKSCGKCAQVCPSHVPNQFNQGLDIRKAVYIPYAQALPNTYCIDKTHCIGCGACKRACQAEAVSFTMKEELCELSVGALILCPGFEVIDPQPLFPYGFGRFPNVLTSLEFERILSAGGPFGGRLIRPYDHKEPGKIAWIQCVGSRNVHNGHGYCSSVCCMSAVKEAVIAREHSKNDLDTAIFFMDIRSYGKDFEKYYNRAVNTYGVRFIRSRISEVIEVQDDKKNLILRYSHPDGALCTEEFDLVVLSVGLQASADAIELSKRVKVDCNQYGFCDPAPLSCGIGTSQPGIFVAGSFGGPKDIPETVMQASAAAGAAQSLLTDGLRSAVKKDDPRPERDICGEEPRIGVFICHCGINIAGVVRVPEVAQSTRKLPHVVHVSEHLFACSQDSRAAIKEAISLHNLNRVVVASCSPRTHTPLFQKILKDTCLNKYLLEVTNIRDQCSWVHMNEPEKATEKAKDLIRMAAAKSILQRPVTPMQVRVTRAALVVGGGITGITCSLSLSELGFEVHLVEKSDVLGGIARRIHEGFKGEDVQAFVRESIGRVNKSRLIRTYLSSCIKDFKGYAGSFTTTLTNGRVIRHGVTVIALGGQEYRPLEYLYGQSDRVMTYLDLERAVTQDKSTVGEAKNVVLINCVGSREPDRQYCSRVCCNKAIRLALKIKNDNPAARVFVLYRDIRTYGFTEDVYRRARLKGILFIRYDYNHKPIVEKVTGGGIQVTVTDPVLGQPLMIEADIVGLAAAILPPADNTDMSRIFRIPLNEDGFFMEAHIKLRPVDFAAAGIFVAGICHGPKNLEENLIQAKAAAGRAAIILSKDTLEPEHTVAVVQRNKCRACLTCVRLCPFHAADIKDFSAEIDPMLCQGCGICSTECPNKAITLQGCDDSLYLKMSNSLFKGGEMEGKK